MSDPTRPHGTTNQFDLDAAFEAMARDVGMLSRPAGVPAAIEGARRRRATRAGGLALVAIVLAGVLWGLFGGMQTAMGPAPAERAEDVTERLPAPRRLDEEELTAATAGWTGAWEHGAAVVRTNHPCDLRDRLPRPMAYLGEDGEFNSGVDASALRELSFYEETGSARVAMDRLRLGLKSCQAVKTTSTEPLVPGVDTFRWSWTGDDERRGGTVFLVRVDDRFAVMSVVATPSLGPPPSDVAVMVSEALAADLLENSWLTNTDTVLR